jgi:hypothetical protein
MATDEETQMSSHFMVTNKGDKPVYVHAMSRDKDGRFTHSYLIEVPSDHSKTFSSEVGASFMVHESKPEHGVLLPRGVPPADVENPNDVPVDDAAKAEEASVVTETKGSPVL